MLVVYPYSAKDQDQAVRRVCSVVDCVREHDARGLCALHYRLAAKTNSLPDKVERKSVIERFQELYTPEPFSNCWLWTGAYNQEGYGQFAIYRAGKSVTSGKAHRLSFQLHKGDIPKGMIVMHSCDTPACVNPAHLSLGTDRDNKHDAIKKGRHAHGEINGTTKLTSEKVLEIRRLFAAGSANQSELGRRYGVHSSVVCEIVHRKIWRHV